MPLDIDGGYSRDIDALAQAIAGEDASPGRFLLARRIATAQRDLDLVRRVRQELLSAAARGDKVGEAFRKLLPRLAPLDRYEQRALAHRHRAIRTFDLLG
jgi:hypothetical protein